MKIHFTSDLHLEFLDFPNFSKEMGGDVLLLVGDIVSSPYIRSFRNDAQARSLKSYLSTKFKTDLIDKFKKVYYVMGNHEHYGSVFSHTKIHLEESFRELGLDKIVILDNDYVTLDEDTVLIGATLWSDFEKGNLLSKLNSQNYMNDFRLIGRVPIEERTYTEGYLITPDFLIEEFKKSVDYIKKTLVQDDVKDKSVIVMTHHAPTYISNGKDHVGSSVIGAYCSELSHIILDHPNIRYWVHGHTHVNVNYSVGDRCKVVAHCRGYRGEKSYKIWSGLARIKC